MPTVQVSVEDGASSASTTVNNGGVVVNGGNIVAGNPMTVNKSLVDMADGRTDYGSKVLAKDGTSVADEDYAGIQTAKSTGTGGLAFFPNAQEGERNFLLRGVGTEDGNNKINNDSSTILTSPASEVQLRAVNTVHTLVDTRRLGNYADASFDVLAKPSTAMVPGRTKGTGAGTDSNFVKVEDGSTAATDDAASPTRAVPGELTYHFGGLAKPSTDEYKARDSYEV